MGTTSFNPWLAPPRQKAPKSATSPYPRKCATLGDVPELSRFFGIIITMYYNDHEPGHFHARYGAHKAIIKLESLEISEGFLPPRVMGLVLEWVVMHRDELSRNWVRAKAKEPLLPIAPLE